MRVVWYSGRFGGRGREHDGGFDGQQFVLVEYGRAIEHDGRGF